MRRSVAAVMLVCGVLSGGCASLVRQTARAAMAGPDGLAPAEQRLRDALAAGRFEAALQAASSEKRGGPGDRLLRDLFSGTAAYYGGRFAESAAAFERAAALADDRYTKSASRGALSLTTNDLALPYAPGHNERLLVHYYGLLAWLRRGSLADAAVEARRLGSLLQQYDADRLPMDAPTRAVLRVVSGAVFAAMGDANDAAVAFRNARALVGGVATDSVDESPDAPTDAPTDAVWATLAPTTPDSGDVLVVVEQGFVAHRVEQRLTVRGRDDGEWRAFQGAARRRGYGERDAMARASSLLTGDAGLWADAPDRSLALDADSADAIAADAAPDADTLATSDAATPSRARSRGWSTRAQLTWPAYRRPAPLPVVSLVIDTAPAVALLRADVSAAEAADFRRDRAARLARSLVRTALREAAASGLEKRHKDIASMVRSVGGAVERADTRSWHLLPSVVGVARVRLPAGDHGMAAELGGTRVSLGTVRVVPGGLALATARLWGSSVAASALTSASP